MFSSTRHQFVGIFTAASLLAVAASSAQATISAADISGIFYGAPGLDIIEVTPGDFEPFGYVYPSMVYTLPGVFGAGGQASGAGMGLGTAQLANGALLGQRGLVMTSTGTYQLDTLGTNSVAGWSPAGYGFSSAVAVNASGLIVGNSDLYSADGTQNLGGRAVYYEPKSSVAHQLALPSGYTDTHGYGISGTNAVSSTGVIVGYANSFNGDTATGLQAMRWNSKTSTGQVLDKLPGTGEYGSSTITAAVNAKGTTVGTGNTFDSNGQLLGYSAIRWDANTTHATALGNLGTAPDGTYSSSAAAINNAGTIVGQSSKYDADSNYQGERAVRWAANATAPVELHSLSADASGISFSAALAINDAGTAVGMSQKYASDGSDLGMRAVSWAAGSVEPTELKLLSSGSNGESFSYAFSINASGFIAGTANVVGSADNSFYDADSHAVVWTPGGEVIDLNTLLSPSTGGEWTLESAYSISDSGWVTGMALYQPAGESSDYAYARLFSMQLMMPVPEPTTTAMLALGLAALALLRRRRQR